VWALVEELTLQRIKGFELCLTIVGTPQWGPCTRECGLLPPARLRWLCGLYSLGDGVFGCLVYAWALSRYGLLGRCYVGDACQVLGAVRAVLAS
jgi:hypothetical protein